MNGITVECLSQALKVPAFDIIKMDIEGAEGRLFANATSKDLLYVDKAQVVALELHEDLAPGCQAAVSTYFGRKQFQHSKVGEMDVYLRR